MVLNNQVIILLVWVLSSAISFPAIAWWRLTASGDYHDGDFGDDYVGDGDFGDDYDDDGDFVAAVDDEYAGDGDERHG